MDWTLLFNLFGFFTLEMIVGCIILLKYPLNFRLKPYISIPLGLLIASSGAVATILVLHYTCPTYYPWNELVNIISYSVPTITVFLSLYVTYRISLKKAIIVASVAYTFQHMAYQMGVIVFDTGLNAALYANLGYETASILTTIFGYLLKIVMYVAFYFTIVRLFKKLSTQMLPTGGIVAIAILLYFVLNIANTYVSLHLFWDSVAKAVIGAALYVACLLFDALIIIGFYIADKREERTIIQATLNAKARQYEMLENNISFLNMKFHDIRKELKRIKQNGGQLSEADFELLEHALNLYDSRIKTGNVNVDALIQDKLLYCKSMDIEFTALVDGGSFHDMDLSDVYFLLSNIIDNAIEATMQIEDPSKRLIDLTISTKQGTIVIEQTNYADKALEFNQDGSIKTTKEDKKVHGYGTKSINYIVKKYDGVIDYSVNNGIFTLKIVI